MIWTLYKERTKPDSAEMRAFGKHAWPKRVQLLYCDHVEPGDLCETRLIITLEEGHCRQVAR